MDRESENYLRGSLGDPYAGGAGQIGYEARRQREERENSERARKLAEASKGTYSSSDSSMKGLIQIILVCVAVESYMNFTGYLVSDFQRVTAFIGAITSVVIVHLYWDLIVKVVIGLLLITIFGALGYDAL